MQKPNKWWGDPGTHLERGTRMAVTTPDCSAAATTLVQGLDPGYYTSASGA